MKHYVYNDQGAASYNGHRPHLHFFSEKNKFLMHKQRKRQLRRISVKTCSSLIITDRQRCIESSDIYKDDFDLRVGIQDRHVDILNEN